MDTKKINFFEYCGVFIPLYLMSLTMAYFYISYYIDKKIVSKYLLYFCVFYFSLFIYLHFISNLDFLFHLDIVRATGYNFDLMYSILDNFYFFFNIYSNILKYMIFPFYIGYSKSGYITKRKRIFDAFFYHYILVIIAVIIIVAAIVIFIIFKDSILNFYGKYNFFLNYLNFLGIIELYMNIGCFFTFTFLTAKKCSRTYRRVYDQIFSEKLLEKVEKDIKKINNAYIKLYNALINSNLKNTEISYYNYISLLITKVKENNNIYKIKLLDENQKDNNEIDEIEKNILKNDLLEDENFDNNNGNIKEDENNNDNLKDNLINNDNNNYCINEDENNYNKYKLELKQYQGMKIYTNFDEIEKEISPYVREFKKQLRNIKRLKDIETIYNSNYLKEGILVKILKCLKCFLIFCIFIIIFFLELLIPQIKRQNGKKNEEKIEDSNGNDFLEFLIYLALIIIFTIINSPYTICLFFIINKRQLISGDIFYLKHTGDNLNLIYTIKTFSGLALPLAYCNLLFYKTILSQEQIPILYNTIKFPEHKFGEGDLFIVLKLILLLLFMLLSIFFEKIIFYKFNDLAGFKILKMFN